MPLTGPSLPLSLCHNQLHCFSFFPFSFLFLSISPLSPSPRFPSLSHSPIILFITLLYCTKIHPNDQISLSKEILIEYHSYEHWLSLWSQYRCWYIFLWLSAIPRLSTVTPFLFLMLHIYAYFSHLYFKICSLKSDQLQFNIIGDLTITLKHLMVYYVNNSK